MARKEVTWKSAPRPGILAEYAPLMCGLTMIAPNGVLPPKLTTLAMLAIHRSGRANFSGKIDEVWAEDMSGLFRCLLSKYRELHNNNESRRICFSRCSMDEMQSVNTVLAKFRSVAGARAENNDEELAAPHTRSPGPGGSRAGDDLGDAGQFLRECDWRRCPSSSGGGNSSALSARQSHGHTSQLAQHCFYHHVRCRPGLYHREICASHLEMSV